MNKVKILTDSCSDLAKDLRDKYDIDYVKMNTVYNEKETPASLDWEYYTPKALYDIMRDGGRVLTTQVPQDEFDRVFRRYASEGYDIVYIGCSLKLSSSVNTGCIVAEKVMADYPDNKIYCIDSKCACLGEGMIAIMAAGLRDEGMSAEQIKARVEEERNKFNQFCTVHNLDALKRAGRVKGSAAFFGNLFGVKPILISDAAGNNLPIKKVKGRENSMNEIVALAKEAAAGFPDQTIYIGHADCIEDAEYLKKKVLEEIPCKDVYVGYIGPIIGASVGPGTVVIYVYGKEVTIEG